MHFVLNKTDLIILRAAASTAAGTAADAADAATALV